VGTTGRRSTSIAIVTQNAARSGPRPTAANDQRQLFDTILNNMAQGVLMFDQNARLIFCNERYAEMYGLTPDAVRPGTALRELLQHRIAAGNFTGDPDQYVTTVLEQIAK
jgi:PAS domain-containing protein